MARATRRQSNRGGAAAADTKMDGASPEVEEEQSDDTTTCPACTPETIELMNGARKESWIECDNCKTWYHWLCAGPKEQGVELQQVAKWYCKNCTAANPALVMTTKAPARKSSRKRTQRDYANLHAGVGSDPGRWLKMVETKPIKKDPFKRMQGGDLERWLAEDEDAMTEPIIIEEPEGLGMKMPPKDLTVEHVAEYIGEDMPLEVMDVASQSNAPGWDLGKWADYVELDPSKRDKILNVISLEISGTELANMVLPPKVVRDMDWVENFWPSTRRGKNNAYPKVQLYCLMGVANAWTDWHIDFAGSSVYYHILKGAKTFYFIRPTPANLAAYEKWSGSELQQTWLGDMVDEVFKVELVEGNTMIIPSGWIHAVHTPVDTIVFGGNFLHSYDVPTQLRVRDIEIATAVPAKFRFPMFTKLCWYTGDKYLRDLKAGSVALPARVLNGILALSEFLVSEARALETGSDQAKKEAKEQIPSDRVKDGPAMARELRWRVKLASGYTSDDEDIGGSRKGKSLVAGSKRKAQDAREEVSLFRNFKPKIWDTESIMEQHESSRMGKRPKPEGTDWAKAWLDAEPDVADAQSVDVPVKVRGETVVRVRRTATGAERQRISREVEEWTFSV
ncbi:hypothetical protein D9619_005662 [Psilocybe cf. subviscida]|uniref:JmjC domain-containing histone demethylation protein 1 n=1 Tax=Psilocybe cf. subviscida TaxID=2480587 RepID=A0A8H5FBI9_9AGAR|nr:hypothetical protein D9619_005662 [Psilocybe cf. subviscida]